MENSIKFSRAYPLNILIAEPCHDSRSSAHDVLTQLGYQPELATSSREMLNMAGQKFYDVILVDTRMPEAEDVLVTCRNESDSRRPIFIAMTVSGRTNLKEMYLCEGMDHSISKPVDPVELSLQLMACSVLTGNRRIRAAS
ncbi:MAG TPA: response regulator [Puia sp.]|jgi:CheY-like chemotaxis protein|nr:response regulator [Puia sp.]